MFRTFRLRAGLKYMACMIALALLPPIARSQTDAFSTTFAGVVYDASQSAIPGAKVTLSSAEKGITRTFSTDDAGRFSLALLPPGT